jgi:hypothetical protein
MSAKAPAKPTADHDTMISAAYVRTWLGRRPEELSRLVRERKLRPVRTAPDLMPSFSAAAVAALATKLARSSN